MNIEGGGISVSAPSIGPSMGLISGPSFGPSLGGFSAPTMEIGPIMSSPSSFSFVNEGPVFGSLEGFSPLIPATPDVGGTIGPVDFAQSFVGPKVEALNSTFPITEPQSMVNIFNEGPMGLPFLENTKPFTFEDFSYNPGARVEIIANPFLEPMVEETFTPLKWFMPQAEAAVMPIADAPSLYEETQNMVWETPSRIMRAIPKTIEVGIAQPLVEEEEETQVQLEAVREQLRGLTTKVNKAPRVVPTVRPQPLIQSQPAIQMEKITYKKVEEKRKEEKTSVGEKNRIELSQRRMVKDLKALAKRLSDARSAIEKAFNQVTKSSKDSMKEKETISGQEVEKYIPQEYDGVRGKALKEDVDASVPDGTYVLGREAIKKIKETDSLEQMQSEVDQAWNENYAVERSKRDRGEAASRKQVEDTYMFVNGKPPLRQTFVRMVKEREAQTAEVKSGEKIKTLEFPPEVVEVEEDAERGPRVEDDPQLKEIFKIAA